LDVISFGNFRCAVNANVDEDEMDAMMDEELDAMDNARDALDDESQFYKENTFMKEE
jgi:hypothetical protein